MYFWKQIPDIQAQRVFIESYLYGVWMIYKQEKRWEKLNSSIKRSATRVCLLLLRKSSILLQIMLFYKLQIFITYFGSFHSFYSIFFHFLWLLFSLENLLGQELLGQGQGHSELIQHHLLVHIFYTNTQKHLPGHEFQGLVQDHSELVQVGL